MSHITPVRVDPQPNTENSTSFDYLVESEVSSFEPPHSSTDLIFPKNGAIKLPIDTQFNDGHRLAITIYSLLMFFSAIGNVYVFISIVR